MNPLDTDCDINYTFTTPGNYNILLTAEDNNDILSRNLSNLEFYAAFSGGIIVPADEANFNINKTVNLNSSFQNNMSSITCNWAHKMSGLSEFTSFSSDCNTSTSFPNISAYQIRLNAIDTGDSSNISETININILDSFNASVSSLSRSIWNNDEEISFSGSYQNNSGSVTCEWISELSDVNTTIGTNCSTLDHTFSTTGEYNVYYTATDSGSGDVVSDSVSFSVYQPLGGSVVSPGNSSNYDVSTPISFVVDPSYFLGTVNYAWEYNRTGSWLSFGDTTSNFSHAFETAGTYQFRVKLTDSGRPSPINEVYLDTVTGVNINLPLQASVDNPGTIFDKDQEISFSTTVTNAQGGISAYSWEHSPNGSTGWSQFSTSASPTYSFSTTGTKYIRVKVTDGIGREVTSSNISLNVYEPLAGSITGPSSSSNYTIGETINFTSSVSNVLGSVSYQWEYSRNSGTWTIFGSDNSALNISFANSGSYEFRLRITDSGRPSPINQIYTSTVTNVGIYSPLSVSISSPTTGSGYNTDQSFTLTANVSGASGGVSSYSWAYSTNQSSWTVFSSATSPSYSFSTTGTKYIRVTVVDGASRSATSVSSYNVVISEPVTPNLTNIVLSSSPSYFNFSGSTYNYNNVRYLTNDSSITVTPTGSGTITVNGTTVSSGSASSPISINDGNEKTITVVATVSGAPSKTYTIKVRKVVTSGGNITSGTSGGTAWRVHRFTSGGTFNSNIALTAKLLVVAGGGGGSLYSGKGGDGGQYRYFSSQSISSGNTTVTIGAGGHRQGWPRVSTDGTNSSFGETISTGGTTYDLDNWGDGHGGANGIGTAGALQSEGGAGAPGISNNITGTSIAYAKGGNGGGHNIQGPANSGNGGSGSSADSPVYGGTGVVIVRLEMPI